MCLLLQEEKYVKQVDELKDDAKLLIHADTETPLAKLELLDSVQRLGLKHLLKKDIKQAVDAIYNNSVDAWLSDDLYSTALRFRILREHGYTVSPGLQMLHFVTHHNSIIYLFLVMD